MKKQPPIVRCFVLLCFGVAIALITLEWRKPFQAPVVTLASGEALLIESDDSADEPSANASASEQEKTSWWQGFGRAARAKQTSEESAAEDTVTLVLSLEQRQLEIREVGKSPIRYDVAVGQEDWQTPTGTFAVMSLIESPTWQHPLTKEEIPPGPDNPLGSRWIGFWTDGTAQIGFHGTNQESLIGEAVSHGCVRMRNADIEALYSRVDMGTQVIVE